MSENENKPKVFATGAFLVEEEKGVYRLYRDIVSETVGPDGKPVREKMGKRICISPFPLRKFQKDDREEQIVVRTVDPNSGEILHLVEIHQ